MELNNIYVGSSPSKDSKFRVDLVRTSVKFPKEHVAVEAIGSYIGVENVTGRSRIRIGIEQFCYLRRYVVIEILKIVVENEVCIGISSEESLIETVESGKHLSNKQIS